MAGESSSGRSKRYALVALLSSIAMGGKTTRGEDAPAAVAPAPAAITEEGLVTLNFPDNMEIKSLVDYVSQRLGLNIVYHEEEIASQRVTLKSPAKVPVKALLALLQSVLRSRGLSLIDGDQPGWKRIAPLPASAVAGGAGGADSGNAITQVFPLRYADPVRIEQAVKPFLSGAVASSFAVPEQHLVLVTDYASELSRIGGLIGLLDQPDANARIAFVPVKHADIGPLALQVKQILTARVKARTQPGQGDSVEIAQDKRTNQLVLIGPRSLVDDALEVVKGLDVAVAETQSPVRFYKLANATAADVLDTLRALEGEQSAPSVRSTGRTTDAKDLSTDPSRVTSGRTGSYEGPTAVHPATKSPATNLPGLAASAPSVETNATASRIGSSSAATETTANASALHGQATVVADTNTNTIIVVGDPSVQRVYEQLIRNLDKRRPQVLIECTIATLDTTNGFTLGVEISGHSKPGGKDQVITFSNFGLSTADAKTGQLTLTPGVGFNGTVISADVADVIIRALANNSRARITSAPRILVNDNATGTLSSQAEFPFTATNISNTIATTSFGDYVKAGTQITLTPHISESDYLQLEYNVTLSSFIGTGNQATGIPPPRQEDSVQSKVTIPDGATVLVGGLNRTNYLRTVNSVPLLGEIPLLKYLFSSRSTMDEKLTLFVFLRPVILRDDQFEDLKFLSDRDVKAAEVKGNWPTSGPLAIQ